MTSAQVRKLEKATTRVSASCRRCGPRAAAGWPARRDAPPGAHRRPPRRALGRGASHQADVEAGIVVYLNRLSDLLFVLARYANHRAGKPEELW